MQPPFRKNHATIGCDVSNERQVVPGGKSGFRGRLRDQSDREVVTSGHGSSREGVHNIGAALRHGQRRD